MPNRSSQSTGLGGGLEAASTIDAPNRSFAPGAMVRGAVTGLEGFVDSPIGNGIGNGLASAIQFGGNRLIPGLGSLASLAFRGIGAGLHGLLSGFGHLIGAPSPSDSVSNWRDNASSNSNYNDGIPTPGGTLEVTPGNAGSSVFGAGGYTSTGAPVYGNGWNSGTPGTGPISGAPSSFGQASVTVNGGPSDSPGGLSTGIGGQPGSTSDGTSTTATADNPDDYEPLDDTGH